MFVSTIVTFLALSMGASDGKTSCPVMGGPSSMKGATTEFNGAKYGFCCGSCDALFEKNPQKALSSDRNKGKTVGIFLFDPISHKRIESEVSKASSEFGGLRYFFASASEKTTFDANPKLYASIPLKESLTCPVSGEKVDKYSAEAGFADYDGVRYYFCCGGCDQAFKDHSHEKVAKIASSVQSPKAIHIKASL